MGTANREMNPQQQESLTHIALGFNEVRQIEEKLNVKYEDVVGYAGVFLDAVRASLPAQVTQTSESVKPLAKKDIDQALMALYRLASTQKATPGETKISSINAQVVSGTFMPDQTREFALRAKKLIEDTIGGAVDKFDRKLPTDKEEIEVMLRFCLAVQEKMQENKKKNIVERLIKLFRKS